MLPDIQKLLVIQDRDIRIRELNTDLERLPGEEEMAKTKLAGDERAVEDIKQEIKENEVAIKSIELDVETRRDTIAKLKVQQFQTRKNEEYQALSHEITRYGDDVSKAEDKELELMEVAEGLKAKLAAAKDSLAKTQTSVDADLSLIADRRAQCEAQLAEVETVRAGLVADVDKDLFERYEQMFRTKKGAALVELEHGVCTGCHMRVIPGVRDAAIAGRELACCDQCGRFLYAS